MRSASRFASQRPPTAGEHTALAELTATIKVLAATSEANFKALSTKADRTETNLASFIEATGKRFETLSEKEKFSWGKMLSFVTVGLGMFATAGTVMSMYITTALSPIHAQNQVSISERAALHEDVKALQGAVIAGKEGRMTGDKEKAVRDAVHDERIAVLWQEVFHRPIPPR